jgi:hypothetical protein
MAFGLNKGLELYFRRLLLLAQAAEAEKLNRQIVHEFDIPGSQQFDPTFFPGFFNDPGGGSTPAS